MFERDPHPDGAARGDRPRTANLLGAAAIGIADALDRTTVAAAGHGPRGPAVLATLRQNPGETVEQLRRHLGLTHSGAVRLVDRLAADGLVTRRAGPDRRSVALWLTAQGERATDALLAARADVLEQLVAQVDPADRDALTRALETILTAQTTSETRGYELCRLCDTTTCPAGCCPVELAAP